MERAAKTVVARIVIDKTNPEVVYVASPGHLFGPNTERGIFKTTDGGKTWNKIKYIDENTGFTDIAIDPSNRSTLYAASYQRRRTSCCFNGGGPGSAVWKSDDAGKTWSKLTSGLPPGTYGRIALGVDILRFHFKIANIGLEDCSYLGDAGFAIAGNQFLQTFGRAGQASDRGRVRRRLLHIGPLVGQHLAHRQAVDGDEDDQLGRGGGGRRR